MSASCSSLNASPYLSRLVERFGEPDNSTARAAIDALASVNASDLPDLKARFALGWSHLALTGHDFTALGRLQSAFADAAISLALREAWEAEKLPGEPEGVFILGLGKLGGHDLNFSSDIDLIAYFASDVVSVPKAKGQAYILNRVMRRLTKILQPPNDPNFVFRVDWRLRPEASVSGLAMSTDRAREFYFFRALPWHRLALMKARLVAGDQACGQAFLDSLTPFLWRQNLDFRTLDELADLKARINLEHPRLKQERAQSTPILEAPFNFNVKLGAGGIREIEFIANAQQLLWGGKHYALRTTNTLEALQALGEEGHIDTDTVNHLSKAYRHHRRLENALQMMQNGHDHVLPNTREDWANIAALMNCDLESLMAQTTAFRRDIHARFSSMFRLEETASPANAADRSLKTDAFSENAKNIIEEWSHGFRNYGVRPSRRARVEPLATALIERLSDVQNPDLATQRIDTFLRNLSRSEQYLSLLAAHPALLDALIDPILYSPHMSLLLEQSPHIIDTFLDPSPPSADFVLAETDYETRLERLRRFVNEGLFQSYHAFLNGLSDWQDLARRLTQLAESALETALTIARDDLDQPDLAISVLGLGKLGQGLMAPQSDLDLVFLFEDGVDRDLAAKAVRRLRTIISAPLSEGIAYELDMRLRPSGRSGPPAVTLSAFQRHHADTAKTWEHIALVPARVVAGTPELGTKVKETCQAILARPRDPDQLIADAHHMWRKIEEERIRAVQPDHFETKLREGGLMMADFWDAVGALSNGPRLRDPQTTWTKILYWERLLGLTGAPINAVPDRYSRDLPRDLMEKQAELERQVKAAQATYGPAPSIETMQPVRWTD